MANVGKMFEQDIQKSTPDYALLYRLPDAAQSFGETKGLRFTRKSPFDFILWNPKHKALYALEMKTVKGKSISFERNKDEHGEIHYHQIKELNKWSAYDGIICGFVIEFREIETTIFLKIEAFNSLIEQTTKKSFSFKDLNDLKIPYTIIPQKKKRTRYTYDMDKFLTIIKE